MPPSRGCSGSLACGSAAQGGMQLAPMRRHRAGDLGLPARAQFLRLLGRHAPQVGQHQVARAGGLGHVVQQVLRGLLAFVLLLQVAHGPGGAAAQQRAQGRAQAQGQAARAHVDHGAHLGAGGGTGGRAGGGAHGQGLVVAAVLLRGMRRRGQLLGLLPGQRAQAVQVGQAGVQRLQQLGVAAGVMFARLQASTGVQVPGQGLQ